MLMMMAIAFVETVLNQEGSQYSNIITLTIN